MLEEVGVVLVQGNYVLVLREDVVAYSFRGVGERVFVELLEL